MDRTDVGDKYVLAELLRSGAKIGGEQSGHIIFPDRSLVGDGMQTALFLMEAVTESGKDLTQLTDGFERFPQVLQNVSVRKKVPFDEVEGLGKEIDEVESELEGNGRLLLRYSGTENLARVMIEGQDQEEIENLASRISDHLARVIGDEED